MHFFGLQVDGPVHVTGGGGGGLISGSLWYVVSGMIEQKN